MDKKIKRILIFSLLIHIALNMAHPVTPMLIRKLNLPSIMFGVFFATMAVGNFFFSPIWGKLSDSRGRKKYMLIGLVGYGVSQLGFGFNSNPIIIVVFRFLGGAFVVSYLTVVVAYISDITDKDNRLKVMSYFAAATTIGGALGSLLGGIIGNSNYKITFLVQFIICCILGLAVKTFIIEEKRNYRKLEKLSIGMIIPNIRGGALKGVLLMLMIQCGVFYFASTSYNSSINYYIEAVLNMPPTVNGIFMAAVGILGFIANIVLTPILGKKLGVEKSFFYVTVTITVFLGLASIISNTVIFFIMIALFVCGCSIYIPILQSLVTKHSGGNYGEVVGIQNSAKAVGMVCGSLYSGFIFDYGSKLPFLTASIILAIACLKVPREK